MQTVSASPAGSIDSMKRIGRAAAAVAAVRGELAPETERLDAGREADVEHERVVAILDAPAARIAGARSYRSPPPPVGDTTERADELEDVVAQALRAGRVVDPAGAARLRHRAAVAVQKPLKDREANLERVAQVRLGDELGARSRAGETEVAQHASHRV